MLGFFERKVVRHARDPVALQLQLVTIDVVVEARCHFLAKCVGLSDESRIRSGKGIDPGEPADDFDRMGKGIRALHDPALT